jgi:predicted AlkP superfamily phosphohydrolase/phosphomutase
MAALENIREPHTHKKVVNRLYKKEEIYHGPFIECAPDIIFSMMDGEYLANVQPSRRLFEKASWSTGFGTHRMEGILIAKGKDIKSGHRIADAEIIDIAPSILNLLNVAIPLDMEGRVLTEMMTDEFIRCNPAEFKNVETAEPFNRSTRKYSPEESQIVHDTLKGLGYL